MTNTPANEYRDHLVPFINAAKRLRPDLDVQADPDADELVELALSLMQRFAPTLYREFATASFNHLTRSN